MRSRHRRPERNFEMIAGKVLNLDESAASLCFCPKRRFGKRIRQGDCERWCPPRQTGDGTLGRDAGLWKLQRRLRPKVTVVLYWWHIAMRFEHALQTARGLGAGTTNAYSCDYPVRALESAK
jgi:hypothetical protein